jgi:hypothetical protein
VAKFSVFSYLYRDASNDKAFGLLLLKGTASPGDVETWQQHFESGEFFIAEQLGIPPLYAQLWAFSDGPTEDDNVWHTFEELRTATAADLTLPIFDTVKSLAKKIKSVEAWNQNLSPHWGV